MKKIIIVILLMSSLAVFAQIPNPLKNTYVNDFAHVLTKAQIKDLNQQIFDMEKRSGVQLAVVLVKKIPAQYDIQDYSLLIGRRWHVGNQKTGLVYVAAIKQHKQRLEVARNLDGILTNQKSTDILNAMKADYADKNYYAGLQTLVAGLSAELIRQPAAQPVVQAKNTTVATVGHSDNSFYMIIGIIAILVLIIVLIMRRKRPSPVYNNTSYSSGNHVTHGGGYPHQDLGTGVGSFATGAIVGAAAGYAARSIQDSLANNNMVNNAYMNPNQTDYSPSNNTNDSDDSDNNESNWGNWGSDDSSSSDYGSSSDSSSSDSGFSDSDSSSDSGATTDW